MHAYITNYIAFGELLHSIISIQLSYIHRLAKGPVTHLLVEKRLVHLDTKFNNSVKHYEVQ